MSDLVDHGDDWSDLLTPGNPIKEAHDCGTGVPYEVYSRQPDGVRRGDPDYILSGSDLKEFALCPHKWLMGHRDDATTFTEWGQLVDCLLMAPSEFNARFVVVPETYESEKGETKPWNFNATACKEWRKANSGKQEVKTSLLADAKRAANILNNDEQIAAVFRESRKQVMLTGFYDDADTGLRIPLRCLIDLVAPAKFLADLKTCSCAHPKAWQKHVHQYGYHEQAARHLDLWNAASGEKRQEFRHYAQESFEPFEVAKRILSTEFIRLGREQYVRALKRYALCLKRQEWPGYDDTGNPHDLVVDGHLVTTPEAWMVAA